MHKWALLYHSPTVRKGEVKVLVGLVAEKSNPISYPLFSLSAKLSPSLSLPFSLFLPFAVFQLPHCDSSSGPKEPEEVRPKKQSNQSQGFIVTQGRSESDIALSQSLIDPLVHYHYAIQCNVLDHNTCSSFDCSSSTISGGNVLILHTTTNPRTNTFKVKILCYCANAG